MERGRAEVLRHHRRHSRSTAASSGSSGRSRTMRWPFADSPEERLDRLAHHGAHVRRRELDVEVARIEARHAQQLVDDRRQPVRLRGDVAEERPPLLIREEDVAAQEGLREAVDRVSGRRSSCETVETNVVFICSTMRSAETSRNAKIRPATSPAASRMTASLTESQTASPPRWTWTSGRRRRCSRGRAGARGRAAGRAPPAAARP